MPLADLLEWLWPHAGLAWVFSATRDQDSSELTTVKCLNGVSWGLPYLCKVTGCPSVLGFVQPMWCMSPQPCFIVNTHLMSIRTSTTSSILLERATSANVWRQLHTRRLGLTSNTMMSQRTQRGQTIWTLTVDLALRFYGCINYAGVICTTDLSWQDSVLICSQCIPSLDRYVLKCYCPSTGRPSSCIWSQVGHAPHDEGEVGLLRMPLWHQVQQLLQSQHWHVNAECVFSHWIYTT